MHLLVLVIVLVVYGYSDIFSIVFLAYLVG